MREATTSDEKSRIQALDRAHVLAATTTPKRLDLLVVVARLVERWFRD